jgi:hypothetical protein
VLAGIALAVLLVGQVGMVIAAGWLLILFLTLAASATDDRKLVDADRRTLSRDEANRHTLHTVVNALIWVAPLSIASSFLDGESRLKLWSVLAFLMTGSAARRWSISRSAATMKWRQLRRASAVW